MVLSTQGIISIACSLAVMAGVVVEQRVRPSAEDARGYHRTVREAVALVPMEIGPWVGEDVEVQAGALALLKPNGILSRRYRHRSTGWAVSLLIVHCQQAGDMAGHYPPICYPNTGGWQLKEQRPTRWRALDLERAGMEYDFSMVRQGRVYGQTVANLILLPDGSTAQDMDGVWATASDYTKRFYGAGQVQMVFSSDIATGDRRAIFELFLAEVYPVLKAIDREEER